MKQPKEYNVNVSALPASIVTLVELSDINSPVNNARISGKKKGAVYITEKDGAMVFAIAKGSQPSDGWTIGGTGGGGGGGIPDAPVDDKLYGRKNSSWVEVTPVNMDTIANGATYKKGFLGSFDTMEALNSSRPSPRNDDWAIITDEIYYFKGGQWRNISGHDGVPEAPSDGQAYARRNQSWNPIAIINTIDDLQDGAIYKKGYVGSYADKLALETAHADGAANQFAHVKDEGFYVWNTSDDSWERAGRWTEEAPSDGKLYGRQDGNWKAIKEGFSPMVQTFVDPVATISPPDAGDAGYGRIYGKPDTPQQQTFTVNAQSHDGSTWKKGDVLIIVNAMYGTDYKISLQPNSSQGVKFNSVQTYVQIGAGEKATLSLEEDGAEFDITVDITDAPNDNKEYVRKNDEWVALEVEDGKVEFMQTKASLYGTVAHVGNDDVCSFSNIDIAPEADDFNAFELVQHPDHADNYVLAAKEDITVNAIVLDTDILRAANFRVDDADGSHSPKAWVYLSGDHTWHVLGNTEDHIENYHAYDGGWHLLKGDILSLELSAQSGSTPTALPKGGIKIFGLVGRTKVVSRDSAGFDPSENQTITGKWNFQQPVGVPNAVADNEAVSKAQMETATADTIRDDDHSPEGYWRFSKPVRIANPVGNYDAATKGWINTNYANKHFFNSFTEQQQFVKGIGVGYDINSKGYSMTVEQQAGNDNPLVKYHNTIAYKPVAGTGGFIFYKPDTADDIDVSEIDYIVGQELDIEVLTKIKDAEIKNLQVENITGGGLIPQNGQGEGKILRMLSDTLNDYEWVDLDQFHNKNWLMNPKFQISQRMDVEHVRDKNIQTTGVMFDRWFMEGANVTQATVNAAKHFDASKGTMAHMHFEIGTNSPWEMWQRIEQKNHEIYIHAEHHGSFAFRGIFDWAADPGVHSLTKCKLKLYWFDVTEGSYVPSTKAENKELPFVVHDRDSGEFVTDVVEVKGNLPKITDFDSSHEYALELRIELSENSFDRLSAGHLWMSQMQLVMNDYVPKFNHISYEEDYAQCQRFLQYMSYVHVAHQDSVEGHTIQIPFPVEMRSVPSALRLGNGHKAATSGTGIIYLPDTADSKVFDKKAVVFNKDAGTANNAVLGGEYQFDAEIGEGIYD